MLSICYINTHGGLSTVADRHYPEGTGHAGILSAYTEHILDTKLTLRRAEVDGVATR
jgi:hypothetical protein